MFDEQSFLHTHSMLEWGLTEVISLYMGQVTREQMLMQAHLDEARAMQQKVPKEAKALMLPSVACGLYLDALQNNAFDVFSQKMLKGAYSPFWHQLQVKRHYLLGTY